VFGGASGVLLNGISNFDIFRVQCLIFLALFLHQVKSAAAAQNGHYWSSQGASSQPILGSV
jgi:hypothetical protein